MYTKHIIPTDGWKCLCKTFEETKLPLLFGHNIRVVSTCKTAGQRRNRAEF